MIVRPIKYYSGDKIKNSEMGRACGMYGGRRDVYRVWVGTPEGKRPLERPRTRWEGILKWIFKKWNGEAWTGLIWFRTGTGGELL
jgi:hypothetical protein